MLVLPLAPKARDILDPEMVLRPQQAEIYVWVVNLLP